jgi:hypothetical protein
MSEFRFLYWDDLGDSQEEVDNQKRELPAEAFCANHQREVDDCKTVSIYTIHQVIDGPHSVL